jgi:sec-independent protein translocase protein TatC
MAGPLIILYELSIWVAYFFGKKDKREREEKRKARLERDEEQDETSSEHETGQTGPGGASALEKEAETPAEGSKE